MKLYQVDAFNNALFRGNPSAVVPLESWLSMELMQNIAEENNLSETVFFVPKGNAYEIKWFTPTCEIDLCGHATLAAAHILVTEMKCTKSEIIFHSKSGELKVRYDKGWYRLNFPSEAVLKVEVPKHLDKALDSNIVACYKGKWKLLVQLKDEDAVKNLKPDFGLLTKIDAPGIIVTAKGDNVDFVSRFFAPQLGINEDPVTGSAHTLLIPFWAKALNKPNLQAIQLSKRLGVLDCVFLNERVEMSGQAVTYLVGDITLKYN